MIIYTSIVIAVIGGLMAFNHYQEQQGAIQFQGAWFMPVSQSSTRQLLLFMQVIVPILLLTTAFYRFIISKLNTIDRLNDRLICLLNDKKTNTGVQVNDPNTGQPVTAMGHLIDSLENRLKTLESESSRALASNHVLSYQRRKADLLLQAMPYGVLVMDGDGLVTYVNQKIKSLVSVEPEQIVDHPLQSWCKNSELISLLSCYKGNASPLQRLNFVEFKANENSNKTLFASVHPFSIMENIPEFQGVLVIIRDISEEVSARQGRDEFVTHVAHELKSPLNTVHMFVDLLLNDSELDENTRMDSLNSIKDQMERLTGLISNLLNIAKLESGTLSLDKERVNLKEFLEDTFNAVKKSGRSEDLSFDLKLPSSLNAIMIDKELFRVALNNLLSNAVKYNRPGGRVSLEAEETGNSIIIYVRDNGIGINAVDQSQVFEKFYRSDEQEVTTKNGQGLGLALVKQIVTIHYGTVSVKSEKGQGSEFRIEIKKDLHTLRQTA